MQEVINSDGTRYRLPDFARQKEGLPDYTANPAGKSAQKTAKTIPSGFVVPPYSVDQYAPVLNFRRHVNVLPQYEQRLPVAQPPASQRAVQPSSGQTGGRAADVAPAPFAPQKLSVQTDMQEELS